MSEKLHYVEGVILSTIPFRDHDRIATLFTFQMGIVKVIFRKSLTPKVSRGSTDPLTIAEFVLEEGRGELFRCRDLSLKTQNLSLRGSLACLQSACSMAKAIETTQLSHKPAPDLYRLLIGFFDRLPKSECPEVLVSSFYLRLLRHEGLLHTSPNCSQCNATANPIHLSNGEPFCKLHVAGPSIAFNREELATVEQLNHSQSFKELATLHLSPTLAKKIKDLFILLDTR